MLGTHEVLVRLAAGGAANVFLVRDTKAPPPGRLLALKVLLPNLAANEDFLNMFFTEARIAARLKHQNIVRIAGFGRAGGIHCLAMEYVFGASLAQVLRASARARKPLTVGVLLKITGQMCDALHYAHELADDDGNPMGIVHRDVTPQNILIGYNGVPKLTDFGIAKATNRGWETQAGIVKGKFCYMSPEQALGKKVDRRSDIFCSGIVLWEALTGRELFKGSTPMEVLEAIREQKIVAPSKVVPGLSPIVDPIVMKALRRSPRQRYQTALEMKEDIDDLIRRAGVTIDDSTISAEFAEIFGDVIVERAFALRAAMAGRANPDELSKALGAAMLAEDHLPEASEGDDDPDPLGLFAESNYEIASGIDDDAIGGAVPARADQPFTRSHDAIQEASTSDSPPPDHDLEEISELEPEDEDSGSASVEDFDEWSDHTRMMEPSDELLSMLSEDDATVGMLPAEFTNRFGNVLSKGGLEERDGVQVTADESDNNFEAEKTIDVSALQQEKMKRLSAQVQKRAAEHRRAGGSLAHQGGAIPVSIPGDDTVLQPRTSYDLERARREAGAAAPGFRSRPVPRAPSLDMIDTETPIPTPILDLDTDRGPQQRLQRRPRGAQVKLRSFDEVGDTSSDSDFDQEGERYPSLPSAALRPLDPDPEPDPADGLRNEFPRQLTPVQPVPLTDPEAVAHPSAPINQNIGLNAVNASDRPSGPVSSAGGRRSRSVLAPVVPSAPPPPPPEVLDRQDGQAQGDARDLLAPGKSSLLSADSLRELAKEAPISQPELAPATSSAPPLWHPTPPPLSAAQIPTDTGVRLRWSILMLLGIALIALGVAVGVMIVKLTS